MTDQPRSSRRRWITLMLGTAASTAALAAAPAQATSTEPPSIDGGTP